MSYRAPFVAHGVAREAARPCACETPAGADEIAPPAGVRQLLRRLNATTRFRFTTLYRLERSRLVGVWVHDRENPRVNARPPADAPACCYRAAGIAVPPAPAQATVVPAERWHDALALCLGDGAVLGVVCHSDARPRLADELAWVEGEPLIAAVAMWLARLPSQAAANARFMAIPAS